MLTIHKKTKIVVELFTPKPRGIRLISNSATGAPISVTVHLRSGEKFVLIEMKNRSEVLVNSRVGTVAFCGGEIELLNRHSRLAYFDIEFGVAQLPNHIHHSGVLEIIG